MGRDSVFAKPSLRVLPRSNKSCRNLRNRLRNQRRSRKKGTPERPCSGDTPADQTRAGHRRPPTFALHRDPLELLTHPISRPHLVLSAPSLALELQRQARSQGHPNKVSKSELWTPILGRMFELRSSGQPRECLARHPEFSPQALLTPRRAEDTTTYSNTRRTIISAAPASGQTLRDRSSASRASLARSMLESSCHASAR